MEKVYLNIKMENNNEYFPNRANKSDAGIDFFAPTDIVVNARKDKLISLDLRTEFPEGYVLIFAEKSGVSVNKKIDILAKVIDAGYRGIVHAHLYNNSDIDVTFNKGDKLVQGILLPCWIGTPTLVNNFIIESTDRGTGGFGSTNK